MQKKMRVTRHNGRVDKTGNGFSPKHADRDFELETADNIDASRTKNNVYFNIIDGAYSHEERDEKMSFESVEEWCYGMFRGQYEQQQQRYRDKRQTGRLKSFEDWKAASRYCPEESYIQVGDVAKHATEEQMLEIGSAVLARDVAESLASLCRGYGYIVMDAAFHLDEAVPQLHERRLYFYTNNDGVVCINQNKALEAMGYDPPDATKKTNRYNSRKMSFDAEQREQLLDICESCGVEVEREPVPGRKRSMSKQEMLYRREREVVEKQTELQAREDVLQANEAAFWKQQDALDEKQAWLDDEVELMRSSSHLHEILRLVINKVIEVFPDAVGVLGSWFDSGQAKHDVQDEITREHAMPKDVSDALAEYQPTNRGRDHDQLTP